MQADVTDAAGLGRVLADIRTRLGRIDLVIHAAGHFDHEHRSLVGKSAQSVLAVLAAKADAAELLADHLADDPPDALVLCSSLSALGAGLAGGQADYAAANAYLDAFAESRRGTQPRVLSIGWPQWSETGMSAGRSLSARALALGLVELDPGDGEAAFARLLGSGAEGAVSIVAASADPVPWCTVSTRGWPPITPAMKPAGTTSPPRPPSGWHRPVRHRQRKPGPNRRRCPAQPLRSSGGHWRRSSPWIPR